jgi:endogenous inhibitor of DNA gyrase (YacG/DUF329 family)
MGVKVKGGMYCPRCDRPVLGQKSGHAVRNTLAIGGAVATAGLSLWGSKTEKWSCPICGGPVIREARAVAEKFMREQPSERVGPKEWRCEQGHVLEERRPLVCPKDGTPACWREIN